jgi:hypothetical protein
MDQFEKGMFGASLALPLAGLLAAEGVAVGLLEAAGIAAPVPSRIKHLN